LIIFYKSLYDEEFASLRDVPGQPIFSGILIILIPFPVYQSVGII